MNNQGTLNDTDTYRIDSEGTIRVDLIDDDGSLLLEDIIVIVGGPAPQATVEPEDEVVSAPEPEPISEPEPVYTPPARPVYRTCKDYNAAGYGNFVSGDPEYTSRRDRDGDGVACEF
nr:excalibur calcium-binding domain-containing protein [cf. Phormidesmis sp. LEGE 11477]